MNQLHHVIDTDERHEIEPAIHGEVSPVFGTSKARPSFLKKRSKKLLDPGARVAAGARAYSQTVLWFFFSKKSRFLTESSA
jgi:hypothetical protein